MPLVSHEVTVSIAHLLLLLHLRLIVRIVAAAPLRLLLWLSGILASTIARFALLVNDLSRVINVVIFDALTLKVVGATLAWLVEVQRLLRIFVLGLFGLERIVV